MGVGEILALLIGGGSLLSSLFGGGGNEQTQTTTSETDSQKYRSPALGLMEPGILSALLGNAQAMGGAGMPGGVSRFGGNADSMFEDILGLLSKDWPNIMGEYGKPDKTKACNDNCSSLPEGASKRACISACLAKG